MNYMKQIAEMLGVKLEEEFYLKGSKYKHKLTKDGLFYCLEDGKSWLFANWTFYEVLAGELEIVKKPKPILDEVEKEYLSNVIKPFRSKVKYIVKRNDNKSEYFEDIRVAFESSYKVLYFPYFEKGTMYKGMELDKRYSLEDLGL